MLISEDFTVNKTKIKNFFLIINKLLHDHSFNTNTKNIGNYWV